MTGSPAFAGDDQGIHGCDQLQLIVAPPSITTVCPVMKLPAADPMNTAAPAISSGMPMRKSGERAVEMLQSTVLIPYPGTPLYRQAVQRGWLTCDPKDYDRFGMREPILRTDDLSAEEIMDWCRRFYRLSFRPAHVARRFADIRSWEDVSYLTRGARAMTGHVRDFLKPRRLGGDAPAA